MLFWPGLKRRRKGEGTLDRQSNFTDLFSALPPDGPISPTYFLSALSPDGVFSHSRILPQRTNTILDTLSTEHYITDLQD